MKKIRLRTICIFILAAASGALLMHTSQNVQREEDQLAGVQADIVRKQESIQLLRTEWAYLNNPERLEVLAKKYLGLQPSDPAQAETDGNELPARAVAPDDQQTTAQPVSYTSSSISSKSPPPSPAKSSPSKPSSLDALIRQVSKGGGE